MNMRIDGMGVVGGFGCGISDLAAGMEEGRSPAKSFPLSTVHGEIQVPMLLADTAVLSTMADRRTLRRIDHHTRMALLACLLAMEDAGISDPSAESLGIIVATGYGSTCNTFDIQELCPAADMRSFSPIQFSNSVHNAAGAHIAAVLRSRGPNLSINQFDLSIPMAFLTAGHWLAEGRVDRVLVGGVDDFARIMAYHRHCRYSGPQAGDASPAPAAVGEGSAFFLVSGHGGGQDGVGVAWAESGFSDAPKIPGSDLCVVGADGFSRGEEAYGRCLSGPAACYTHLYGHLPVAMAFDVAAAVLSLRAGRVYASAGGGVPLPAGPELILKTRPLETGQIHCLKIGAAGGYGRVVLEKR
jgi:3-oxoacyl-[acyl-carrier-protein] synthase II